MSPGVLAHLLHTAGSMTLDSGEPRATNISADPRALHPRVPLIAMMTMANVLPPEFVSFLPANPSGEAVLGVVTHTSGSTYGAYKAGDSIDGQFGGKALFTPRREHILSLNAVAAAGSERVRWDKLISPGRNDRRDRHHRRTRPPPHPRA